MGIGDMQVGITAKAEEVGKVWPAAKPCLERGLSCKCFRRAPVKDVDRRSYGLCPEALGQASFQKHSPCPLDDSADLPFAYTILVLRIGGGGLVADPLCT